MICPQMSQALPSAWGPKAAVIILAGLYLIKGKKIQLDNNDEYSKTDKDVL